jgi:anti-anti-sigma factor
MRLPEKSLDAIEYQSQAYPRVEAAVLARLRGGARYVVLDLDAAAALDTEALRGLISLLRTARATGGEIALRSSRSDLLRTLSVTGLDRVFTVLQPQAA